MGTYNLFTVNIFVEISFYQVCTTYNQMVLAYLQTIWQIWVVSTFLIHFSI